MKQPLSQYIDHTLLRPDATKDAIERLCAEGILFQFASVCVNPFWAKYACSLLQDSPVKVCSTVGFPLGASTPKMKASEAHELVKLGVTEIDMVLNIGALKSKEYALVLGDIQGVVEASMGNTVKVIIETCLLSDEEKKVASLLCVEGGAHFVKTSTGFSKSGASLEDIQLIRRVVGPDFGIKASGGISERSFALNLIEAGATRIGTSKGVELVVNHLQY